MAVINSIHTYASSYMQTCVCWYAKMLGVGAGYPVIRITKENGSLDTIQNKFPIHLLVCIMTNNWKKYVYAL